MTLTSSLRKLALTAHVTSSVGWLGAVAAFLALAVSGLNSSDEDVVQAAYVAMNLTGWAVIVPLSLTSLPTGVLMSLGTEWGLFRHYWVVAKLTISVLATLLLLVHMQPVGHLARVVTETTLAHGEMAGLRIRLVADAGAAVVALLAATALSVYKPRGLTAYGTRVLNRPVEQAIAGRWTGWNVQRVALGAAVLLVLVFLILHLAGGSARH
jgi:hypothetical protein